MTQDGPVSTNDRSASILRARRERDLAIHTAAQQVNADLASITSALRSLEPTLADVHSVLLNRDARRPMAARLLVARELRRAAFIAIGHRFAMALLPVTIELLTGRHRVEIVAADHLNGARGRVFRGESATIATTIRSGLAPARAQMYQAWTLAERDLVMREVRRLSGDVSRYAEAAHQEEFGQRWTGALHREDPYRTTPGSAPPYRSRTLTFLAHHLDPRLDVSLRNSELGQAEHLAVGVTDLHHAFAAAGCPMAARLPAALAHLRLLSGLAALRDEVAERIVFDRDHSPLYGVRAIGEPPRWAVIARRAPLNSRLPERRGRCPAVDVLPPVSARHRELVATFRASVGELTAGTAAAATSVTADATGVSAADVSAAFALAIAGQYFER